MLLNNALIGLQSGRLHFLIGQTFRVLVWTAKDNGFNKSIDPLTFRQTGLSHQSARLTTNVVQCMQGLTD